MRCSAFSHPGCFHKNCRISCEDEYAITQTDTMSVIVVCDGAGTMIAGANAAKITAALVSDILYNDFDKLFYSEGESAKRRFINQIDNHLTQYGVSNGIPVKELACTILAAAVDKNGRCICIHLGDGIIIQKRRNSVQPEIISSPMSGLKTDKTFLTMNCEMIQYMQFYRWKDNEIEKIVLMTDGAAEHIITSTGSQQQNNLFGCAMDISSMKSFLERCKPNDDYSCGILERNTRISGTFID